MKGKVFPCFISFFRRIDINFTIKFSELVKKSLREKLATDTPRSCLRSRGMFRLQGEEMAQ